MAVLVFERDRVRQKNNLIHPHAPAKTAEFGAAGIAEAIYFTNTTRVAMEKWTASPVANVPQGQKSCELCLTCDGSLGSNCYRPCQTGYGST